MVLQPRHYLQLPEKSGFKTAYARNLTQNGCVLYVPHSESSARTSALGFVQHWLTYIQRHWLPRTAATNTRACKVKMRLFLSVLAFVCTTGAAIRPSLVTRQDSSTLSSYDYVIIGGGTSGLTVANRLTEDPGGQYM